MSNLEMFSLRYFFKAGDIRKPPTFARHRKGSTSTPVKEPVRLGSILKSVVTSVTVCPLLSSCFDSSYGTTAEPPCSLEKNWTTCKTFMNDQSCGQFEAVTDYVACYIQPNMSVCPLACASSPICIRAALMKMKELLLKLVHF